MLKKGILAILNKLGYTLARSDWFEVEKAHTSARIADAYRRVEAEKAHTSAKIADANRRIEAERAHASAEIAAARERANEEIERILAIEAERANEEIERVRTAEAERTNEEIERVLADNVDALPDAAAISNFGDLEACRPQCSIVEEFENWAASRPPITEMLARIESSAAFTQRVLPYFAEYPRHSFISGYSRAYLYCFVRALKPSAVAEIGTLFAGTTEVIARALVENGSGVIHTIDPFGALRAPPVIATWPQALRRVTHFHPVYSMSFFSHSAEIKRCFDLVLIDGNHDLEFAFFDLLMAARLTTPLGLIFVDNAEQRGPFVAVQKFMRDNPEWTLLGTSCNPDQPFAIEGRSSLTETGLIVLQAPADTIVGNEPISWGHTLIASSGVDGIRLEFQPCAAPGTLHYKATMRAFGDGVRRMAEYSAIGQIAVSVTDAAFEQSHKFANALISEFPLSYPDSYHTFEVELAWRSANGKTLRLKRPPEPLLRPPDRPNHTAAPLT
jgi:predicted O-methyltransferase YrrM